MAVLRVLVVDDSPLMRRVLATLIESDPELCVVASAGDGHEAIRLVEQLRPDVITMDVRMPVLDGLAATEHIMAYCPTPILVLTASLSRYDVNITFKMLEAGALDVLEKPAADDEGLARAQAELLRRIKLLARVKVVTHLRGRRATAPPRQLPPPVPLTMVPATRRRPSDLSVPTNPVVIVGASTGGPRVLQQLLSRLPLSFAAPILIVQHIAEHFMNGMIDWLNTTSALPVRLASDGYVLTPGEVVMAPERRDLLLKGGDVVALDAEPLRQHTSIDHAMQSVARVCGSRAIGVLLSGMGSDGAAGLLALRTAGAYTIAQNQASCTIFGMPQAAIERGAAMAVLTPEAMVETLRRLVPLHMNRNT